MLPIRNNHQLGVVTDVIGSLQGRDASGIDGDHIRLLVESPRSPIVHEVWSRLGELSKRGVYVSAVFAKMPNKREGEEIIQEMIEAYNPLLAVTQIRVAKDVRVKRMFEQATFGSSAVWMGQRMDGSSRRSAREGEVTIIDDEQGGQIASIARLNFAKMWAGSESLRGIPQWRKSCLQLLGVQDRVKGGGLLLGAR